MTQQNKLQDEPQLKLKYSFEYSQIAQQLWGQQGMIIVNLIMITYLIGTVCIKCITGAQGLAIIISFIFEENTFILTNFQFSFILFFLLSIYLCCKNMSSGSSIQNLICLMRLITFCSLIAGSLFVIHQYGNQLHNITLINIQKIPQLYQNIIFALLMHHSIPVMIHSIKPQQSITTVIFYGVNVSSLALFFVCFSAMASFSGYTNECSEGFPCTLNQVYSLNFSKLPLISLICNAYLFLVISSFSINIQTFRNNLKAFPSYNNCIKYFGPLKQYENSILTCIILLVIAAISYLFRNDLSSLIDLSGGITGLIVMIILPSMFLIEARNEASKQGICLSKSSDFGAYLTLTVGILCLEYAIYKLLF